MKKNGMLKFLAVVFAAFACVVALGACAQSPEDQVKAAIEKEISNYKSATEGDTEQAEAIFGDTSAIEDAGVDPTEFAQSCVKHYTYTIQSVDVTDDGTQATATLEVTNIDLQTLFTNAMSNSLSTLLSSSLSGDTSAFMKAFLDDFIAAADADDAPTVTNTVTVDLTKNDDGEWEFDTDNLYNKLIFGGQSATYSLS